MALTWSFSTIQRVKEVNELWHRRLTVASVSIKIHSSHIFSRDVRVCVGKIFRNMFSPMILLRTPLRFEDFQLFFFLQNFPLIASLNHPDVMGTEPELK